VTSRSRSGATRRTPAAVALTGALTAVLTAALTVPLVAPAVADPGDDDVAAAQAAVDSGAAAVARIELELSVQQGTLDQAWTAVAVAGEAYTQASADAQAAADESRVASDRAAAADRDAQAARDELSRIALEAYRSGGSLDAIGALVDADGLDDLLARHDAVDRLGKRAQTAVQRLEAAQLVADTLQGRATAAEKTARDAQATAEASLGTAQAAQESAEQTVTQVQAERDRLVTRLAQARHVAVEVERQRQAQLDAERQARAEAAARAQRTGTGSAAPSNPAPVNPAPSNPAPVNPAPTNPAPADPTPSNPTPPAATPPPNPAPPAPSNPAPAPSPPAPSTPGLGTGTSRGSAASGQAAVEWARAQVGKAYVYGAAGPDTFDCSGLTMRSWQAAGVSLHRTSRDQYRQALKISYDDLRPGDLVFYGDDPNDWSSVYHVAMYVGGGQVVEAPRPGLTVRVTSMRWSSTMAFAGRP
jgi:cell wall-associated NlpC family hydrolase